MLHVHKSPMFTTILINICGIVLTLTLTLTSDEVIDTPDELHNMLDHGGN